MNTNSEGKYLTLYSDVRAEAIKWLWYPYIAYGKITILQGDPGDGKSSMMMDIIARLSQGRELPDGQKTDSPHKVIYQCSEDGVADTIKPRLVSSGADCRNVAFLNEEIMSLTLDDDKLRSAIVEFGARVLVIDPIQAYLSNEADLQVVGKARRMMRRLAMWASMYDCAVVLIGHMNKKEGTKGLYRSLGSIDLVATARSVLQIEREENTNIRYLTQVKNNLGPLGDAKAFEINLENGLQWVVDTTRKETCLVQDTEESEVLSLQESICDELKKLLSNGPIKATQVKQYMIAAGYAFRSVSRVKKELGIYSVKDNGVWYWSMSKNTDIQTQGKIMKERV